VRPAHPDPRLPNVLLLGDSISRDYFPIVSDKLSATANVYLMATSVSVGDERLELQIREFASMEGVRFSVVHFNNGMHGWGYDEEHYKAAFPDFIRVVRKLATRHGVLIWASTTPVKSDDENGPTNRRIDARNAIAASMLQSASIMSDDQHTLMQHQDRHSDLATSTCTVTCEENTSPSARSPFHLSRISANAGSRGTSSEHIDPSSAFRNRLCANADDDCGSKRTPWHMGICGDFF